MSRPIDPTVHPAFAVGKIMAERKKLSKNAGQMEVERFNLHNPPGTPVEVRLDNGCVMLSETRGRAELLGGHTPVVWVKGIAGAYLLERVSPRYTHQSGLRPRNSRQ